MPKDIFQGKGFSQRRFGKKNGAGFTLVEILVVVFIIGLIAAILIVSLRKSNKESNLRFVAQNLVSVLKQAQTHSLSGKTTGGDVPAGGYGIYVRCSSPNNTSYIFFADRPDGSGDTGTYDPSDQIIETINLPEDIIIGLARYVPPPPFPQYLPMSEGVITFVPPEGTAHINGSPGGQYMFTLYHSDLGKWARVEINADTGLIQQKE